MREAAKSRWFLPALVLMLFVSLGVRLNGAWPEDTTRTVYLRYLMDDSTVTAGFCIGVEHSSQTGVSRVCTAGETFMHPPAGHDVHVTGFSVVAGEALAVNVEECEVILLRETGTVEEAQITVGAETVTNTAGSGGCTNGDITIDDVGEGCILDGLDITFVEGETYQFLIGNPSGACTGAGVPHTCCTGAGAGCLCTGLERIEIGLLFDLIPN